ncbi:hypothetical protein CK203_097980 [Vitis vinifera]|uniref:Uncharacterized protein n=1 Tax=Vitis vinifera TaxID=29760 RepID=A0A438CXY0_VITVI|nr:hypothetical protein CK203_097980 [Vitis vinifera]
MRGLARLTQRRAKSALISERRRAARPPATKEKNKTKKTLAQVLRIAAPTPKASSSSCRFGPNRPDHTIPESEEAKEPEATSSSLLLVIFHPGPSSPQPEPESTGLQVVDEPEEMRHTSNLRMGLLRRHGKQLASSAAPSNAAGSSTAATVKADALRPSSPVVVETPMSEGVLDASNGEEAPDEKGSHAAVVPPSWDDLMEMLKGLLLFHVTLSVVLLLLCPGYSRHPLHDATREQLFKRLKLEKVEAELATARKEVVDGWEQLCRVEAEKEAIRAEADILKKEKEALEGQVNEAGQENLQLKREKKELRASLAAQKKESEDLLAGLAAQKEEMEARFAAQKKEMEVEY